MCLASPATNLPQETSTVKQSLVVRTESAVHEGGRPTPASSNLSASSSRRNNKAVSFPSSTSIEIIIPAQSPLDFLSDWSLAWYLSQEIADFENADQMECIQLRQQDLPLRVGFVRLALDCESRGLETRVCTQRQLRQQQSRRLILSHARTLKSTALERLASLAQRATRYARELAIEEAARDQLRAQLLIDDEQRVHL